MKTRKSSRFLAQEVWGARRPGDVGFAPTGAERRPAIVRRIAADRIKKSLDITSQERTILCCE